MNYQHAKRIALALAALWGAQVSVAEASPLSAYYELGVSALGKASDQALLGLVENYAATAKSLIAIVDSDLNPDLKDPQFVIKMVEAVMNHDMMKARGGLVGNLTNISESSESIENVLAAKNLASSIGSMLGSAAKFNEAAKAIGKSVARGESGVVETLAAIYHGTMSINDLASLGGDAKDFMQQLLDRKLTAEQMREAIGMLIAQSGVHTAQEMEVIRKKDNALWQKLMIQEAVLEFYKDSIKSNNTPNAAAEISVIRADFVDGFFSDSYKEGNTTLGSILPDLQKIENDAWRFSYWSPPSLPVTTPPPPPPANNNGAVGDKVTDNTKKIENSQNANPSGTEYDGELTAMLVTPGRRDLASLSLEIEHASMRHTEGTVLLGSAQPKVKLIHQPSQFDYMSWGNWLGEVEVNGVPEAFTKGSFIVGRVTTAQEMPKAGTATYSGAVRGEYGEGGVVHRDLGGTVNLTASFNTGKIGGSFAFKRGDGSPLVTAAMPTASSAIVGSDFHGQLAPISAAGSGAVYGKFYGPKAQEVGGGFYLFADDKAISGVFGAKKQ